MWKPGQLVTINHKVYRVTKIKIESVRAICNSTHSTPHTLICMCCDLKRGTNLCLKNCGKIPFFCYLKLV